MPNEIDFEALAAPLKAEDITWRVKTADIKNGKPWALVLAYVTSRAIMDRLDEVVGAARWTDTYMPGPAGGVMCGIGVQIDGEWVWKYDGADNTDVEAVKGGYSAAFKRAAVKWGIGRYLYNLKGGWANIHDNGKLKGKTKGKDGKYFKWDPPALPKWALLAGAKPEEKAAQPPPDDDDQDHGAAELEQAQANAATAKQIKTIKDLLKLDLLTEESEDYTRDKIRAGMNKATAISIIEKLEKLNAEADLH